MNEYIGVAAFGITTCLFLFTVYDRVWGAGNRASSSKDSLREYIDAELKELRREVFLKHDTSEGNIGQAVQAMKDLLHKQELEALEFRVKAAETYMRRDSFYAALDKFEEKVQVTLDKIDGRLARMEARDRA